MQNPDRRKWAPIMLSVALIAASLGSGWAGGNQSHPETIPTIPFSPATSESVDDVDSVLKNSSACLQLFTDQACFPKAQKDVACHAEDDETYYQAKQVEDAICGGCNSGDSCWQWKRWPKSCGGCNDPVSLQERHQ